MPKSDFVFRVASEDDDTEDEIEIIPYVKPAPVVIDLLESESDNEESRKKSPKKKSKKKKSKKRESERGTENSTSCSTSRNDTSEASVSSINVDTLSQPIECLSDNSGVEEIASVQVVEPTTSVEVENGSGNVDTPCNISSTGVSAETPTSSSCQVNLREAGPSSLFEKCQDAQSTAQVVTGKTAGIEMVGVSATATPSARNDNDKRRKSKEKKPKGENRSRVRTMSATQRTNEEIVSFLTTLGIQMETSAFETPPTRRRASRKRQSLPVPLPPQPPTDDIEENSRDSLVTNSSDGSSFPRPVVVKETGDKATSSSAGFVSVTQETNSPAKLDQGTPKGRRQRQAIAGDISDYTVSFKDLTAVTTNIRSNIVVPPVYSLKSVDQSFITVQSSDKAKASQSSSTTKILKPCYYAEVIDLVAKGLDSSSLSSTSGSEARSAVATSVGKDDARNTAEEATGKKVDQVEIIASKSNKEIDERQHFFKGLENADNEKQTSVVGNKQIPKTPKSSTMESPKVPTSEKRSPIEVLPEGTAQQKADVECITILEPEIVVPVVFKQLHTIAGGSATNVPVRNIESTARPSVSSSIASEKYNNARKEDSSNKRKRESNTSDSAATTRSEFTEKSRGRESDLSSLSHDRKRRRHDSSERTYYPNTKTGDKTLSSDSQTVKQSAKENSPESCFPNTWTEHMKDFYGSSHNEDFELEDVMRSLPDSRDLWSAYKDWMLPPSSKRRHVRCDRCKQLGHLIKECKEKWKPPTCHYCGKVGHTAESHSRHNRSCPDALCLNCGRRASRYAQKCHKCLMQNRPSRCEVCNVLGHDKSICPDNWRRYHSMISAEDYLKAEEMLRSKHHETNRRSSSQALDKHVYKRTSALFCSNCGRNGHTYYDCNASKFNTYPRNKPFVIRDVKISDPPQSTNEARNANLDRKKGVTTIPISFDRRTGRTVVLNAEADDQPELAVETIQIKITNDLALKNAAPDVHGLAANTSHLAEENISTSSRNESIKIQDIAGGELSSTRKSAKQSVELGFQYLSCDHESCTNRLPSDEKCYQSMISASAHLRLLEAQHQEVLKPLEEKYNVQICVINNHILMVHITGSHVLEAETDLYRLLEGTLWRKQFAPKNVAGESNSAPNTNTNLVTENSRIQEIPSNIDSRTDYAMTESDSIVIVDEDDDITCIEPSVRESKSDLSPKSKRTDNLVNNSPQSNPSFYLDETPSSVEVIDSTRTENEKTGEETTENSTPCTNKESVSPSWKNYESRLTGLCLAINPPENTDVRENQAKLTSKEKEKPENPANVASTTSGAQENVIEVQQVTRCYDIIQVIETLEASSDFSESSSDHTEDNRSIPSKADQSQSQDVCSANDPGSPEVDLVVVDPPPKIENYEVITIDDDDEPVAKRQKITEDNENQETVSLLPSEWNLVITESMKKGSILDRIASTYDVVFEVSKESSSIIIREGTKRSRKSAKEGIVYWLESQCLNTGTRKEHEHVAINGTPKPGPSMPKKRVLNLNDAHQSNLPGERARQKRMRWKEKKKMRKQKKMNSSSNAGQDVSPTGSSSNSTCSSGTTTPKKKSKKGNASSSLYNSRSPLHSPSPKKMRR